MNAYSFIFTIAGTVSGAQATAGDQACLAPVGPSGHQPLPGLSEMVHVAKPGARIAICDENERGARAYERTLPGFTRSFEGGRAGVTAPVDSVPEGMQELRVFDVGKSWMYCLEFGKRRQ